MMEDYIDKTTGLLYCGRCHTPKEVFLPDGAEIFGTRKFRVLCQCEQEARDRGSRNSASGNSKREFSSSAVRPSGTSPARIGGSTMPT